MYIIAYTTVYNLTDIEAYTRMYIMAYTRMYIRIYTRVYTETYIVACTAVYMKAYTLVYARCTLQCTPSAHFGVRLCTPQYTLRCILFSIHVHLGVHLVCFPCIRVLYNVYPSVHYGVHPTLHCTLECTCILEEHTYIYT